MNRLSFLPQISTAVAATLLFSALSPLMADDGPVVILKTSMGEIDIQLDPVHAPITTANFLAYVKKGFYDGTIFHRVLPGFMIQGGGFTPDLVEKTTDPTIKNESNNGLSNLRGTIAMARRPEPDSASAQFFLNLVDNQRLDAPPGTSDGYAVFGKVIKGLDVMDKIAQVPTANQGGNEAVPLKPIFLKSATIQ